MLVWGKKFIMASHARLFGYDMSIYMRQFLKQLSFSFVGLTSANAILFGTLLLVGRLLGPKQFGLFALALAVSQLLIIPMLLGMDVAVMRSVAINIKHLTTKRRMVSSGFLVMASATVLVSMLVFAGAGTLSAIFDIDSGVLRAATALALALAFRMFFDGVIRGEGKFRFQAEARTFEAVIILLGFVIMYWLSGGGYALFVVATMAGAVVIILSYITAGGAGRLIGWQYWQGEVALDLWRYIRFGMVGAVAGLLLVGGDKFLIERMLGQASLGVYAAYYYVSVQVAAQLSYVFINVFFPMVSRHEDKLAVLKKLERLIGVGFIPAVLLTIIGGAISLRLLGGAYMFSWRLILCMSVYAMLFFVWQTYWWFIASTGAKGVRFIGLNGLVAGTVYLISIYWLVGRFGIFAPAMSFFIAFVYLGGVISWWKKRFTHTIC
ncbi:MAG: oligosaccharide flippase family protein [bacterium]